MSEHVEEAIRLARVLNGDNARMRECGGKADLAQVQLMTDGARQVRLEQLDGDRATAFPVFGEVDRRHAAAPERAFYLVIFGEDDTYILKAGRHYQGNVDHLGQGGKQGGRRF